MGTIVEKLEHLKKTKAAIRAAINGKGVLVSDNAKFSDYAEIISSIKSYDSMCATIEIYNSTNTYFYYKFDDGSRFPYTNVSIKPGATTQIKVPSYMPFMIFNIGGSGFKYTIQNTADDDSVSHLVYGITPASFATTIQMGQYGYTFSGYYKYTKYESYMCIFSTQNSQYDGTYPYHRDVAGYIRIKDA